MPPTFEDGHCYSKAKRRKRTRHSPEKSRPGGVDEGDVVYGRGRHPLGGVVQANLETVAFVDHVVARALDALARRRNGSGPEKMSGEEEENREDEVGRRGHEVWRYRGEGTNYGGSSDGVIIIDSGKEEREGLCTRGLYASTLPERGVGKKKRL
ncbi:hypothetical protein B296_00033068, partial [Ensete ventricosum]